MDAKRHGGFLPSVDGQQMKCQGSKRLCFVEGRTAEGKQEPEGPNCRVR